LERFLISVGLRNDLKNMPLWFKSTSGLLWYVFCFAYGVMRKDWWSFGLVVCWLMGANAECGEEIRKEGQKDDTDFL